MNIRCLPCKFSLSWSVSSFPVQQVNRISMSQFGNYVEMQTSADTYCSIGDEIVRNENATVPPQMLAQRSLSSPDHVRNLPRPPPAQPVENPSYDIQPLCYGDRPSQKQRTTTLNHARQRDRCASGSALTLPLSSSLPTIYQVDSSLPEKSVNRTRGPVQNGHTDPETEPYLAAQDVPVDEELGTIPSTYLRVNKLSERNFWKDQRFVARALRRQIETTDFEPFCWSAIVQPAIATYLILVHCRPIVTLKFTRINISPLMPSILH